MSTQRMSRVQRIILIYMLLELQKPRIIKRVVRRQTIGADTVTSLAQMTVKDHDLLDGLGDDDHTQYALLAGRSGDTQLIDTLNEKTTNAGVTFTSGLIYVKCKAAAPIARYYVKKTDDTILPFFLYHETLNRFQMGVTAIPMIMASPMTFNAYCTFNYLSIPVAIHPSPVAGSMYYDTATDTAYFYDGANWNAH